jgi:thiol-disulfide isomerase/thioredoxin
MGDSLTIGPLSLATDRLMALVAIAIFVILASVIARHRDARAEQTGWLALGLGLLFARLSYVATHRDAFTDDPWSALYFWQGGFAPGPGLSAAIAVIVLRHFRSSALMPLLGALVLAGGLGLGAAAIKREVSIVPLPAGIVVTTTQGRPVPLDGLRGRPLVINVWATWCPPCRRELPMLIEEAGRGTVPVLLVSQGESRPQVLGYLHQARLTTAGIHLDERNSLGRALDIRALPTTLFIDAEGRIVRRHTGEISRAAVRDGIDALTGRQ